MRRLFNALCLLFPPSRLKPWLLNLFEFADIDPSAKIGFCFLGADQIAIGPRAQIGNFARLRGGHRLEMLEDSRFGPFVTAYCAKNQGDSGSLYIGRRSLITRGHHLDLTENITLGDDVVVGGLSSEFWTHGFDTVRNRLQGEIAIGDRVYFGSRCIVNPGVRITANIMIGSGSVITKSLLEPGFYAGNPARRKSDRFVFEEQVNMHKYVQRFGKTYFKKRMPDDSDAS